MTETGWPEFIREATEFIHEIGAEVKYRPDASELDAKVLEHLAERIREKLAAASTKCQASLLDAAYEAMDAIHDVHRAFGAPGDYGYDSKEGKALLRLYDSTQKLAPHLPKRQAPANMEGTPK